MAQGQPDDVDGSLVTNNFDNLEEELEEFKPIPMRRETEEKEEPKVVEKDDDEEDEEIVVAPVVPAVEDPGTYEPKDYSFDVTLKDGKTKSIKSVDDWESLLEDDPEFKSAAELLKYNRLLSKMENGLEKDKKDFDEKKENFENAQAKADAQQAQLDTWEREINYLSQQGSLPKVTKEMQELDWTDPEVQKVPEIKEQIDFLKFFQKENKNRIKAGLTPINSAIDAFNAYDRAKKGKEIEDKKTRDGDARKRAGSMVAGQGAPTPPTPKGLIVGTGGSLNDLDNDILQY